MSDSQAYEQSCDVLLKKKFKESQFRAKLIFIYFSSYPVIISQRDQRVGGDLAEYVNSR
jgi:hypothetical protein